MATSYLTSASLIDSIKRRESIPTAQVTFQDEDFLAFANEELVLGILPTIMQYHEEFFVYPQTIPLVSQKSSYPIPYRAIGSKVRDVIYIDTSNNKREMARIFPEDEVYFQHVNSGVNSYSFFYIQNNNIVIVPDVPAGATGSLIVTYYLRPNQLVAAERAAQITAINTSTGVITFAAIPTGMVPGTLVDFIETKGSHRSKQIDVELLSTTNTTITVAPASIPDDLIVGDYINFAGETIIPQIPDDLHVMLAQRVAARCLEALGDVNGLAAANQKISEMEQKTANLIDNRVEGAPQKVVNLRGFLRRSRRRR